MSVVLALDLSTRKNGYCYGDGATIPECDAFVMDPTGDDIGLMLDQLDQHVGFIIERTLPSLIVFEAPILPSGGKKHGAVMGSAMTRRKLFNLSGHVEWIARKRNIACAEAHVFEVKRELAGKARASKDDMVRAAERCGITLPATEAAGREDAADSFGIWLLGLRMLNRRLSQEWDRRLWSSRGALL